MSMNNLPMTSTMTTSSILNSLSSMPLLTISSPSTIDKCSNLPLQDNDVFITSYPKSGTTWTQHIVLSLILLHRRKILGDTEEDLDYDHVSDYAPFYEIDPHWDGDELIESIQTKHKQLGRRVFNTHLRGDMLPNPSDVDVNVNSKVIYVVRSPMDTCLSFYYHLSHQEEGCYEKPLDDFFQEWVDGKIPFGSWPDHLLSYAPMIARGEVLVLCYEDMVRDLPTHVERLVKFLDLDGGDGDDDDDGALTKDDWECLLPSFGFESMKKDLNRFQPKSVTWRHNFQFLRKGVVGDHKEQITEDQMEVFKKLLRDEQFFEKLGVLFAGSDAKEKMVPFLRMTEAFRE